MAADMLLPEHRQGQAAGQLFLPHTISLDGFAAGPNIGPAEPMGEGGERLHAWMADDQELTTKVYAGTGAFIIGRRTFDLGLEHWGEDGTYKVPCFVVTHRAHEVVRRGPTTFTFVVDGIASALAQARAAAGAQRICLLGGATLAQHYLAAGLVDEIELHIAPVLLGAGTRLFDNLGGLPIELERTQQLATPNGTHLRYRVVK